MSNNTAMLHNKILSQIFDHMADLYLLRGLEEDRYRISTYRRVAQTLRYHPEDVAELDQRCQLQKIPGVGPAVSDKIHEFLKTGKIETYEQLKKGFPPHLLELLEIPSLGPKKVQMLWRELGVTDRNSLLKVLKNGQAEALPGFGPKSVQNILSGIEIGEKLKERKLMGLMVPVVEELREYLRSSGLAIQVEPAGSYRRKEETIGDIDFLATSKYPTKLISYFTKHPAIVKTLAEGDTKASVIFEGDLQVDLRVVQNDEWGSALQYFTGSKDHNVHLRTLAREQGMTINEYGLFQLTKSGKRGKRVAGKTEKELYRKLGLQYIPPEMRTDTGEIEAAASRKKLPQLIQASDIRGDLHVHTKYSDGVDSIEEMARKADELGLEYMALTDHSPSLIVAHGLKNAVLMKKLKEIDEVQPRVRVKLLKSAEVDILANGTLDYPDEILAKLDLVVASVHTGFTKDNTTRIMKTMENPYVTIIGHISGRMFGTREAYPINYEKLFAKAVETGTWIEINAQPYRQDLAWNYIRQAKAMGVKFVISTDSHTKETLWYRELGVAIARRGWLEKRDVVNTLPLKSFLHLL